MRLEAACFFAAAGGAAGTGGGGAAAAGAGRAGVVAGAPGGFDPVPGSGVMMLTAGVLAELGNSALVGRPVGIDAGNIANGVVDDVICGAFQDAA